MAYDIEFYSNLFNAKFYIADPDIHVFFFFFKFHSLTYFLYDTFQLM